MAQFDLPLEQLRSYSPDVPEAHDFDDFWRETLALDEPVTATETPFDNRQVTVDTLDVTFTGFGGHPVRAWLHTPVGVEGPLPTVVRYHGYSGGRGMPLEHPFADGGYAEFVMDNRAQAWAHPDLNERTLDPHLDAGGYGPPGPMTNGIWQRETYYFRRLITDTARFLQYAAGHAVVDPTRVFVQGASQGGYLTLAAAGLAPSLGIDLAGVMPDVPFMCNVPRGVSLTDNAPYREVATLLRAAPHLYEPVWETLQSFDGMSFARRATAPALWSVALADMTCPPSTVFAAYNVYGGEKDITVYPYSGHEGGASVQTWHQLGWMADRAVRA